MATLGERIRDQRKKLKMTLEQLAATTESAKSYIWELENKNPPRPSGEKIAKIARALNVTSDYLLGADQDIGNAEDLAFFRKYSSLPPETKQRIRKMTEIWDE
ncbi:helix-turn-helix domain-containing protein [Methylobacterium radiotolerans]